MDPPRPTASSPPCQSVVAKLPTVLAVKLPNHCAVWVPQFIRALAGFDELREPNRPIRPGMPAARSARDSGAAAGVRVPTPWVVCNPGMTLEARPAALPIGPWIPDRNEPN